MNLEKFIELLNNNLDSITITYKNINGEESLMVNGEPVTITEGESFDDSDIKQEIAEYKQALDQLDDCVFIEAIEQVTGLKEFDEMLNKEHFTEKEAQIVHNDIRFIKDIIVECIENKIIDLINVKEMFE